MSSTGVYAFFDLTIGGVAQPRIIFELFTDKCPRTCENFLVLCDGDRKLPDTETAMAYKGSSFHRVIKQFMIQGGDYTNHNGTGGVSIFGESFADEDFSYKLSAPGLLAMANRGANTNGSQFFITCAECPHLNGKHVVFGRVVRGMNTVRTIESTPTGQQDKPLSACVIAACGRLPAGEPLPALVPPADGDVYADYPQDAETPLNDDAKLTTAEAIRLIGNEHFKKGAFADAISKYEKALRYLDSITIVTTTMKPDVDKKRLTCHSNSAQCFLKLEKWAAARSAASNGLEVDANDVKLLFRRATASFSMGDFDEAKKDYDRCKQLDPANADVTNALAACAQKIREKKDKQAAAYKKMFE